MKPRLRSVAIVVGILGLALFWPGGLLDHWPVLRWTWGGPAPWPHVERYDLSLRLDPPGGFSAEATIELSGVAGERVMLLLNDGLEVTSASVGGEPVGVTHGLGLFRRFHSEGRVVHLLLDAPPADGRVTLRLAWSGDAEHGESGNDWRGILLVDEDEARMCEQTVFYPQVPLAADGPAKERAPFRLSVDAPAAWELHASGQHADPEDAPDGRRLWRFASERPALLNLVGGRRMRAEVLHEGRRVATLLRDEHADLAQAFSEQASLVLAAFTEEYGAGGAGSLCIFEQVCRPDSSYNWAAEGLIVFDRWALGDQVPLAKLAHEIAHLWWGQTIAASGPGERFLTEGFSEASSWWYLEQAGLEAKGLARARKVLRLLAEEGSSDALRNVSFGHKHYQKLAYGKSGLVHRYVLGSLDERLRAAFLREYRARAEACEVSVDDWLAALAEVDAGLSVPWIDHAGDLLLSLGNVAHATGEAQLVGTVRARSLDGMPARVRVTLEVVGRGFRRRLPLDLLAAETPFTVDVPAGAVVSTVRLDPDDLLPLGTDEPGLVILDGPRLLSSTPAAGAQVPYGLEQVTLVFDRALKPFTLEEYRAQRPERPRALRKMRTPAIHELRFEDEGRKVVLAIRPLTPDGSWWLPLRGSWRGAWDDPVMEADLRWSTGPSDDETAPRIVSTDPRHAASGVPIDLTEVVVVFDEVMQRGVGFRRSTVKDLKDDGYGYPEMDFGRWDATGRILTLPIQALEPGIEYALPIGYPLRDLSGNEPERFDLTFTTVAGPER